MQIKTLGAITSFIAAGYAAMLARKNVIIDTDLHSDVDDAGALLLGATLPGLNLLGVNINHPGEYSALAASAILEHYGRPDIPIGIVRPMNNKTFFDSRDFKLGEYTSKIAYHWSGGSLPWGKAEDAWDPIVLYRKLLSEAEDGSVTIASIGFLDNLSGLLNSTADEYSHLSGRELAKAKVVELAIMGGTYPKGRSWNFWGSNSSLTAHVLSTWDGQMTFVGDDVGDHVLVGGQLMNSELDRDPVKMAYIYYGYGNPLPSWDPLTILYVANGLGSLFMIGEDRGCNKIGFDGTNEWIYDGSDKGQRYLRLKANNETAAAELDRLFLDGAKRFSYPARSPNQGRGELRFVGFITLLTLLVIATALALLFRPARQIHFQRRERVRSS